MSAHRIYIFTRAVHSGKTTTLQQWLRNTGVKAGGILTPNVDGKRMLYDISEDKYYEMEAAADAPDSECLLVGKYRFTKESFRIAREILERELKQPSDWLIVDEIGKLELEDKMGLEPTITHIINSYKNIDGQNKLMLVIRNYLLDEACERYQLNTDMIINKHFFE
ncbi:MAG: hypothetical protein K0R82_1091 [Flavipsychrobacter sp.]|jgi:nucleoside-triphosphatase THEP1|nr:hypothetical protein [Flavipsychrobacter sp.]